LLFVDKKYWSFREYIHILDADSFFGRSHGAPVVSCGFPSVVNSMAICRYRLAVVLLITCCCVITAPLQAVEFSSYFGGSGHDAAYAVALDDQGRVLVAGLTRSEDFPVTTGVVGESHTGGESDVFVLLLSTDLSTVLASTYIGGSDHEGEDFTTHPYFQMGNWGPALALDAGGEILLTGATMSADFPVTTGAYQTIHNTLYEDAFLLRLSPGLDTLVHSTFFGGSHMDFGRTVVVEPGGTVVVGGDTRTQDFPVTDGAFDTDYNGAERDTFLIRFADDLSAVTEATYFGGAMNDFNRATLCSDSGQVYITGWTISEDLPSTRGAFDRTHNGGARDIYIACFSANFSRLEACTYLGGHDWGEPYHGGEHEGGVRRGRRDGLRPPWECGGGGDNPFP